MHGVDANDAAPSEGDVGSPLAPPPRTPPRERITSSHPRVCCASISPRPTLVASPPPRQCPPHSTATTAAPSIDRLLMPGTGRRNQKRFARFVILLLSSARDWGSRAWRRPRQLLTNQRQAFVPTSTAKIVKAFVTLFHRQGQRFGLYNLRHGDGWDTEGRYRMAPTFAADGDHSALATPRPQG